MAVLIKRGVKSSQSRSMCADLSCRVDRHLWLNPLLYQTQRNILLADPPSSPPTPTSTPLLSPNPTLIPHLASLPNIFPTRHAPRSARVRGQRLGWKFCVLLSAVCFSVNRGDNTWLPHLKGTTLYDSLSRHSCIRMKWIDLEQRATFTARHDI